MEKYIVFYVNRNNKLCLDEVNIDSSTNARNYWRKYKKGFSENFCCVLKKSEYNRDRNKYNESVIKYAEKTKKMYTVFYRERRSKYYNPPIFVAFVEASNHESAKHIIREINDNQFTAVSAKRCSISKYTVTTERGETTDIIGYDSLKDSIDYLNKQSVNYYIDTPIVVDYNVRFKKMNIIEKDIDFSVLE